MTHTFAQLDPRQSFQEEKKSLLITHSWMMFNTPKQNGSTDSLYWENCSQIPFSPLPTVPPWEKGTNKRYFLFRIIS